MTGLANFFSAAPVFTIFSIAISGVIGFVAGFLLKMGVIAKYKRKVLLLEDEMLSNHARILGLEKQLTDLKNEKIKISAPQPVMSKIERKAS